MRSRNGGMGALAVVVLAMVALTTASVVWVGAGLVVVHSARFLPLSRKPTRKGTR